MDVCLSVHHMCAWCLPRPESGVRCPKTGVTDGCEPSCVCWESNLGPPEGRPVLTAELSPSPEWLLRGNIVWMQTVPQRPKCPNICMEKVGYWPYGYSPSSFQPHLRFHSAKVWASPAINSLPGAGTSLAATPLLSETVSGKKQALLHIAFSLVLGHRMRKVQRVSPNVRWASLVKSLTEKKH